jgi:CRP/FNR family transcriptional regulator, nitrogen fixation regulation protein
MPSAEPAEGPSTAAPADLECSWFGRLMTVPPPRRFAPGAVIYAADHRARHVYQVALGAVRTVRESGDGTRIVRAFHLPGDVFGLEPGDIHLDTAEAVGETRVLECDRRRLDGLVRTDPAAASELWAWMLAGERRENQRLSVLGRANATGRVVEFLLDLARRLNAPRQFRLPMSRADIADYLALTSETVSRVFTVLREDGAIAASGRSVTLLDLGRFRRSVSPATRPPLARRGPSHVSGDYP